ncbi:hypothetical protein GCM10027446_14550 [Angustibacter peucedani]
MSAVAHEPALRQLPVPCLTPPVELVPDDGTWLPSAPGPADEAAAAPVQGTLQLVLGGAAAGDGEDDFGPVPTGRAELPDPQRWSHRLVQVLVEVMGGHRPATQLLRWTTPEVYERVRALTLPRPRPGARPGTRRPVVRSVRVCEPADGVAEVGAVVLGTHRAHALAVRLEGRDGRWRVTALECG